MTVPDFSLKTSQTTEWTPTMYIASAWEQYFSNHHEGLGTTYERFILHRYFEKIKRAHSIQSVLEVPSFGMTGISGINSLWWAQQGAKVTVVDENERRIGLIRGIWQDLCFDADFIYQKPDYSSLCFKDKSFDMSWNFASLAAVQKPKDFLKELARVTKKVIFICVPNKWNIASFVRFGVNKQSEVCSGAIRPRSHRKMVGGANWHCAERGFFDVPPWPDIAMKKEDLMEKIGFKRLAQKMEKKGERHICILDHFSGKNPDMERTILKYAFLENSPRIFKRFWAHHQYFIFISNKTNDT